MVALKIPSENEEDFNERFKIENTIYDMLDKVMEENDSSNSLNFGDEEFDEELSKISRYSTRHQTSDFPNQNKFKRQNKKNLTEVLNIPFPPSSFNNAFCQTNYPLIETPSFNFQNGFKNDIFSSNIFSTNFQNNIFGDNTLNQPIQSSLLLNNQNINIINNNSNFIRNNFPFSNVDICNGINNTFNNCKFLFNFNKILNNDSNIIINENNEFKRGESRKKTYDIPLALHNNINKYLKNKINRYQIQNSDDNNLIKDKINTKNIAIKDNFIYELKNVLEKTGKIDYNIYNLIKGKFLFILKNHKGSKLFQKYIKTTYPGEIIHLLYLELSQNLEEFITDSYSNYFCKKFYTFLGPKDRIDFLKKIENSIVKFSCDSIGTYPIQTIIENINSKFEKIIIISSIKDHIEELAYDPFGCHVLEKLLSCIEEEYISFIYSYISANFLKLAYNSNGICIVKKIMAFTDKLSIHDKIKKIVKENSLELIKHPYGNFVIQVIIECWKDYKEVIYLYINNFFNLSLEKYASNVIERFIERDELILKEFIAQIIESKKIYEVMKSNYGNYVIQKAIKLSKNELKQKIVFEAAKEINNLCEKKLIIRWKSLLFPHIKLLTSEQLYILKENNYFEK